MNFKEEEEGNSSGGLVRSKPAREIYRPPSKVLFIFLVFTCNNEMNVASFKNDHRENQKKNNKT